MAGQTKLMLQKFFHLTRQCGACSGLPQLLGYMGGGGKVMPTPRPQHNIIMMTDTLPQLHYFSMHNQWNEVWNLLCDLVNKNEGHAQKLIIN